MAYEEPDYEIVYESDLYEIRFYGERLVVQTNYGNEDNGFMKLFRYISGSNTNSEKIDMTTPVTQSNSGQAMVMQFYLPSKFDKTNVPLPNEQSVEISSIPSGHFAAITYSGRSTDRNFNKKAGILKKALEEEKISIQSEPIKATYNGPFTLPPFRRNEAMYRVNWRPSK
tara:strand:+ start:1516 stop:2025 length:510 start_codon:yes stop_codon:yes gene_type:complete